MLREKESSENLTAEQKKKRRLARNRESARECRRRKKEYTDSLAAELTALEAENLQLRLKLKIGVDSSTIKDEERDEIIARLDVLLQEGNPEGEIRKEIELLQEKYSDYGRDRTGAIAFHLSQLRKCLVPTQTTRTLIWLMTCAPHFHNSDGSENSACYSEDSEIARLWRHLLEELQPSLDQKKKLVDFTADRNSPYPALQRSTDDSNSILDRLDEIMTTKNTSLASEMSNIHGILTPRQIAKFVLWIDQNPVCLHMLELMWPHIDAIRTSLSRTLNADQRQPEKNTRGAREPFSTTSSRVRPVNGSTTPTAFTASMGSGSGGSVGSESLESEDDLSHIPVL
jgi:hypothetical protein